MNTDRIILFNVFIVFLFFVFAHLSSSSAITISGAVDEFIIVMVEFPFIVNDPVALILNLYGFTICVCFVPLLYSDFCVYGSFWNDASSNKTIISFVVILCSFKFFLTVLQHLMVILKILDMLCCNCILIFSQFFLFALNYNLH